MSAAQISTPPTPTPGLNHLFSWPLERLVSNSSTEPFPGGCFTARELFDPRTHALSWGWPRSVVGQGGGRKGQPLAPFQNNFGPSQLQNSPWDWLKPSLNCITVQLLPAPGPTSSTFLQCWSCRKLFCLFLNRPKSPEWLSPFHRWTNCRSHKMNGQDHS